MRAIVIAPLRRELDRFIVFIGAGGGGEGGQVDRQNR